MSDEELIDEIVSDDEPVSDDTPSEDTPSDTPTPTPVTYCTVEDITNLFGDNVSDSIETDLIDTAIVNATGWIHGRLRAKQVPLPDPLNYSSTIHTVAMYYTASDCYGALFNGDDYQVNFDMWYIKAKELLDDYIEAYWNSCAEEEEQIAHSVVKHSRGLTYNEKRRRRRWY